MQITLKQDPDFYTKSKDGKELTYVNKKTGKPTAYKKVRIHSSEHEKPLWGAVFDNNSPVLNWKGGQMVDIEVEQSGEYLNFKVAGGATNLAVRLTAVENRLTELEKFVMSNETKSVDVEEDIKTEDLPF